MKCPCCESERVNPEKFSGDDRSATQELRCLDCGSEWEVYYTAMGHKVTFESEDTNA